jgi:methyl-accepting chemotaxis protein
MKIKWSIRNKLLGGFAMVLILLTIIVGYSIVNSTSVERDSHFMSETASMNLDIVEKLRTSMLQVQQLLTDSSATGTYDGIKESEVWANKFRAYVNEMHQKCMVCHVQVFKKNPQAMPDTEKKIKELAETFEAYYTTGKKMAVVYIKEGRESGNKVMEEFDGIAKKINEELDGRTKMGESHFKNSWKQMNNSIDAMKLITIIISVIAIAIGIVIAFSMASKIENPIKKVAAMADRIASGDLSGEDLKIESSDEIGELAVSLNRMKASLNDMIKSVVVSSDGVVSTIDMVKVQVEKTNEGARNQSGQAQQIAAAAEEMSQTITDIARNASVASETSAEAMEIAESGQTVTGIAVETVNHVYTSTIELSTMVEKLNNRASEIGDIVTVIKDIADQTNLLALNAAIEAARAGEQGRGFAVVADEVRKLAERTITATAEISEKIHAIQSESTQTTKSMGEASKEVTKATGHIRNLTNVLEAIVESVQKVRDQITQIATAVDEQSAASEEVARNIEKTSAIAKDMEGIAEDVMQEVKGLADTAHNLKSETKGFITV